MVVEFYFQDYITLGILTLIAIVVIVLCLCIDYLIKILITNIDMRKRTVSTIDWVKNKEISGKQATYYFKKRRQ
jgi:hypothetical protein